jgi:hypothetical protein
MNGTAQVEDAKTGSDMANSHRQEIPKDLIMRALDFQPRYLPRYLIQLEIDFLFKPFPEQIVWRQTV